MDHEIHGGELWWREIIRKIQQTRVFLFALSEDSWKSQPCREELDYAQRLRIPVLPVQVGSLHSVRIPIMETQGIDYRERNADAALALVAALTELIARPLEPPDPLPEPPKVPFEYLYRIAETLGPLPISPDHQEAVIGQLRRKLKEERDGVARADIVKLLREFRRRSELTVGNAEEIDLLLDGVDAAEVRPPEDGTTRLPPTDHWRRGKAAGAEPARPEEPVTPAHAAPRPTPPSPPTVPPRIPKADPTPKPEPRHQWRRSAAPEPTSPPVSGPPRPPDVAPAWLGTLTSTDGDGGGAATDRPHAQDRTPPSPPTAQWWNTTEERKSEPPVPPVSQPALPPRDHRLAFVSAVLGSMGIPFVFAAPAHDDRTAAQVGLVLLLILSVLGLSIGLVSANRGEPRSRVAVAIAIVGLLGVIFFAAATGLLF